MSEKSRPMHVTVLGSGSMGHGIAQVSALSGFETTLYDIDTDAVDLALSKIRANLDKGIELGKVTTEQRDATMSRLFRSAVLPDAVRNADLVVEAAPESMELKQAIFGQVEASAKPGAVLASNTSSLSIAAIAAVLDDRSRFLGLHFFNPVHIMKLVEVVWGPETSEETQQAGMSFAEAIGKEPILVKDSPGFASSRLGVLLGLEAIRMVEQGVAEPQAIDRAMELGYRHPMGPLRLTDLVGLDVRLDIADYLHRELGSEAFRAPELLRTMVAEGRTGRKSGRGFYEW